MNFHRIFGGNHALLLNFPARERKLDEKLLFNSGLSECKAKRAESWEISGRERDPLLLFFFRRRHPVVSRTIIFLGIFF